MGHPTNTDLFMHFQQQLILAGGESHQVASLVDAAAGILLRQTGAGSDQRHYISFVTGPSRTADIERTLTIGVHGPKTVYVIVVAN